MLSSSVYAESNPLLPVSPRLRPAHCSTRPLEHGSVRYFPKSFICNIYRTPRKCCKQKTYVPAKPFRCNIYKKPGGHPLPARRSPQLLFHRCGNDFAHALTQCGHFFFGEPLGVNRVVQKNRDFRRPDHPVACAVMLKGANQTYRHDGNAKLLRDAKAAILELIHMAVARALRFGKNDQAGAALHSVLRQA